VCKQDDILIGGDDENENLDILEEVLNRLSENNVHLKLPKCEFLETSTVYLGLEYSGEGLRPVESSVQAVKDTPIPKNVSQLRSFLGMVQYYHQFLPDLAMVFGPLRELLLKGVQWHWSEDCQRAYYQCKGSLTSEILLVHYDSKKKLWLACDASSYGLMGAVLSHEIKENEE
jgi:hypothetical protein